MAKQGMKRPEINDKSKNEAAPVPEIQGKAKHGNKRANPIISGTHSPSLKVFHTNPYSMKNTSAENYAADVYAADIYADNDLAEDNLLNDLTAADLQDLY